MKTVSVLVPCYNEELTLRLLYEELTTTVSNLQDYNWEFLFVDDGSKDKTLGILQDLHGSDSRVNYLSLSRNFGKENALLAGFDYVKGDCTIIMDADLQHPPSVFPLLLQRWEEGYDDVYGRRITRGKESWLRKTLSLWYYRLLQRSAKVDVMPNVGDFRLLDKKCINTLRQMREFGRYTKGMYSYIGYRKIGVDFETQERVAGDSKMSVRSLVSLAVQGFLSFTVAPLRWATFLGMAVSLGAFAYMIFVLVKTLIVGDPVAGYPSLMIVLLFLGGVQLLSLGIIGEYLGKVFEEIKHRPVYIVQNYNGIAVMSAKDGAGKDANQENQS